MDVLGHGLSLPLNRQSLDLATGPLINFGGASAAYSLRDLNGRNPRVVRVRRASDNSERDFYEDGVNSGELVNWVNAGENYVGYARFQNSNTSNVNLSSSLTLEASESWSSILPPKVSV